MVIKFRSPRKRGQHRENKLVAEWLDIEHPTDLYWKRVRLGPVPGKEMLQLFKLMQRYVDAVVYKDNTVILIEAKLKPSAAAVGQLLLYKELFYQTPMFESYWDKPVKLIKLTTQPDAAIEELCRKNEVEYVIYSPEWLKEG